MPEAEVDNKKQSEINNSYHHMIISSSKNVLKMEAVDMSKKRKFQTDQSDSSLLPLPKHACFDNVACSEITNGSSEIDSEYSMSYVMNSSTCNNNEIEMKEEESSGSCGGDNKMMSFENHIDFIYNTQKLEDYTEKDIENILYPNDDEEEEGSSNNGANYVLSSGRWTVNQDSTRHDGTKKPTIDQEFEQYFSTLML